MLRGNRKILLLMYVTLLSHGCVCVGRAHTPRVRHWQVWADAAAGWATRKPVLHVLKSSTGGCPALPRWNHATTRGRELCHGKRERKPVLNVLTEEVSGCEPHPVVLALGAFVAHAGRRCHARLRPEAGISRPLSLSWRMTSAALTSSPMISSIRSVAT